MMLNIEMHLDNMRSNYIWIRIAKIRSQDIPEKMFLCKIMLLHYKLVSYSY